MSYSIEASDNECYEGTLCLKNKLGITDEKKLLFEESLIAFDKSVVLEAETPQCFDVEYYKYIHRFLFEDIYYWAGNYRTVNLSKGTTRFAPYVEIDELMTACFERLKKEKYFSDQSHDCFAENIADLYCVLNNIHPFREGNGRTERIFISKLIHYNGYYFKFSEVDAFELNIATIQASSGIRDNLISIFKNNIK